MLLQNTVEWLGHFVLWVILMIAAVLVIIWEYSFPPNVHPATASDFAVTHFAAVRPLYMYALLSTIYFHLPILFFPAV